MNDWEHCFSNLEKVVARPEPLWIGLGHGFRWFVIRADGSAWKNTYLSRDAARQQAIRVGVDSFRRKAPKAKAVLDDHSRRLREAERMAGDE